MVLQGCVSPRHRWSEWPPLRYNHGDRTAGAAANKIWYVLVFMNTCALV